MLFGQIHRVPHNDLLMVALQCPEQTTVTVHNYKPESIFSSQQTPKVLCVEFTITELN